MPEDPLPSPDIGATFARVQSRSIVWLAVLVPANLAYLAAVFYFAREVRGASRLLGLPAASAEAVLVDLLAASVPLIAVIYLYVRHLNKKRRQRRAAFLTAHAGSPLVYVIGFPNLIYRTDGGLMQIVWNADGPVAKGPSYPLPAQDLIRPLDPAQFKSNGMP